MNQHFAWSPVTLIRQGVMLPVMVAPSAAYDPEMLGYGAPLGEVTLFAMPGGEGRSIPVGEIITRSAEEFRFLTPNGNLAILRATRPEDAADSGNFGHPYDLPVEVIGAVVNGAIDQSDAILTAAYDNEGDVHTLILETPLGLYARYSKQWIKLTDVGVISHLAVVNIAPEDLDAYDEADINGNMVNLEDLNPETPAVIEVIQEPPSSAVTAAGPVRAVVVASVDDLPDAIRYAQTVEGEGSRFYVERRAKALGYTDRLPWRRDES